MSVTATATATRGLLTLGQDYFLQQSPGCQGPSAIALPFVCFLFKLKLDLLVADLEAAGAGTRLDRRVIQVPGTLTLTAVKVKSFIVSDAANF